MNKIRFKSLRPYLIIILVLLMIDQGVKFWIKTRMTIGQDFHVLGDWFLIRFVENNGFAFGLELPGVWGKYILSIFRIGLVFLIGVYLIVLIKKQAHKAILFSITLITAGALGNIIDGTFYGMLFSESTFSKIAVFLPETETYASFLRGNVVDMLYFPIIDTHLPQWIPFWGGEKFIFFSPIFNIADSCVTIGMFIIVFMVFFKRETLRALEF